MWVTNIAKLMICKNEFRFGDYIPFPEGVTRTQTHYIEELKPQAQVLELVCRSLPVPSHPKPPREASCHHYPCWRRLTGGGVPSSAGHACKKRAANPWVWGVRHEYLDDDHGWGDTYSSSHAPQPSCLYLSRVSGGLGDKGALKRCTHARDLSLLVPLGPYFMRVDEERKIKKDNWRFVSCRCEGLGLTVLMHQRQTRERVLLFLVRSDNFGCKY